MRQRFALITALLVTNSVLVLNSVRYMAVEPAELWRDNRYIRNLPNLLKCLYDSGFASPWPHRASAFAAYRFRCKLLKHLEGVVSNPPRVVELHLGLWAFMQLHDDLMLRLIRRYQVKRASADRQGITG